MDQRQVAKKARCHFGHLCGVINRKRQCSMALAKRLQEITAIPWASWMDASKAKMRKAWDQYQRVSNQ